MHQMTVSRRMLGICFVFLASTLAGCATRTGANGGPLPQFAEYAGREVGRVEVEGEIVLPRDSLEAVIVTQASRCRILGLLPFCIGRFGRETHQLNLNELAEDVTRIRLYHRDHGYYGTRVVLNVDPMPKERVSVRFLIEPGNRVTLDLLSVEGTADIVPLEELRRKLPIQEGGPFRRIGFLASSDTIRAELLRRGYAYAQVLRNYSLDTIANVATAEYVAIPGPLVRIDSIMFYGGERLGERHARRQLSIREGDILRTTELNRSQRNLFDLGLVNFASVGIAPDTLQLNADSASASVLVQIVEAPRYLVDTSAGFGTVDCVRGRASWTDRNFFGGARRFEVSGTVSKLGARAPLDLGLDQSLCRGARLDTLSNIVDYRVAADFQQPRLFGSRNLFSARVFAEQASEMDAYMRRGEGAQFALTREIAPQTLMTATANVENGLTLADPVVFCTGFETCDPEAIEVLQQRRWSNSIGVTAIQDRSVGGPNPTGGHQLRGAVDFASPLFLSDDQYLRFLGDGAAYRLLRPGFVLAGRLLVGSFLQGTIGEDEFIPPDRRFYAGGPNSVRGFRRNELGPRVYVQEATLEDGEVATTGLPIGAATGGTQMLVSSVELRMPSPIFRQNIRFATFVDAGQVWARGSELESSGLKITPGVGVRIATPVGPIRVDAAYNPYVPLPGRLYLADRTTGELILLPGSYEPPAPTFLNRIRLHIAVGQAF